MDFIFYSLIALLLIALVFLFLTNNQLRFKHQNEYQSLLAKNEQQSIQITQLSEKANALEASLAQKSQQYLEKCVEYGELKARLEALKTQSEEKQKTLIESEQRLTTQFENLANRIFEQSNKKLDEQNKQSLDGLLSPLKERLDTFKKQVQDSFGQEAKERHTLTFEIRHLQQLNAQMAKEAINLTNALKGNNKTQGNWGEVILNRVLESSGLREGHEYELQVNLKNDEQKRLQPDVIVHLPKGNDVIIDAKVTLNAYERYFNSQDEQEKNLAISQHLVSVRQHIKKLGEKNYQKLEGIKSLDYILMFIPIEPAFLLAIDQDPSLINEALDHNIMIVSPTTLLVALRTISNLWRYEHQNQHAQSIADKASKLYDKFRGFIEDMESLGNALDKAKSVHHNSMKKLSQGRGNMVGQIEQFRLMGVEVKKPLPEKITEQALNDFNKD